MKCEGFEISIEVRVIQVLLYRKLEQEDILQPRGAGDKTDPEYANKGH